MQKRRKDGQQPAAHSSTAATTEIAGMPVVILCLSLIHI